MADRKGSMTGVPVATVDESAVPVEEENMNIQKSAGFGGLNPFTSEFDPAHTRYDPEKEETAEVVGGVDIVQGYKGRYIGCVMWMAMLTVAWGITRATCAWGFPDDCNLSGTLTYMSNLQIMYTYGVVQAWMCNLLERDRFLYLFNTKRWYFFVLFFAAGPIFSWIMDTPLLETSLSSGASYSSGQKAIFAIAGVAIVAVIVWHFVYAWRLYDAAGFRNNFWVYTLSRFGTVAYFTAYTWMAIKYSPTFEVHHFWLGWALSLFGSFSHPISLVWLAITTAIFVQGIGAYDSQFLYYSQ